LHAWPKHSNNLLLVPERIANALVGGQARLVLISEVSEVTVNAILAYGIADLLLDFAD
jgi:hypothetical protein